MNPDIFAGAFLVSSAIISITIYITKRQEIEARYNFQARKSKEYKQLRQEADQWRAAYEEERAKNDDLNALLKIQNLVYGKKKVKDINHETDR